MNKHNGKTMKQTFHYLLISFLMITGSHNVWAQAQAVFPADGYGRNATGGGNAGPINVYNTSDLRNAIGSNNATVIIVHGRINMNGDVNVGSNTTVIGANTSSGLYGGAVKVQGNNYIFQNLTIGPHNDGDGMEVSGATNVFITKCEFFDGSDGNCDIVREADFVTVSYCKFYYINQTDHKFSVLIGNGDGATGDRGKLHVTMHHNWFAERAAERMPRVRFGHVHIYNNYYNSTGNGYCIGTGNESHIRVENTHFENVNNPWKDYGATSSGGTFGWSNLRFDGASQPGYIGNSFPVFSLPYQHNMDPVNDVENNVKACAGNVVCGGTPDCNGTLGGTAYLDDCNRCVEGNTGVAPCATSLNEGIYRIQPVHSNLCLADNNPSTQENCAEVAAQYWEVIRDGDNYQIRSLGNDQYLSAGSGVQGENTGMSSSAVTLSLGDAGNGNYYIQSADNPALVFDVLNVSTAVGEPTILWENTGADNQHFTFESVSVVLDCNRDINGSATLDDCGICSGGNTGVDACMGAMQGEDFCEALGVFEDSNEGFMGTGYINFDNQVGSNGKWYVHSETSGSKTIGIRYANGGTSARGMSITVNGSQQVNFQANQTASWTTWESENITLNLNAGVNEIVLTATTAEGGPNVDLLSFVSEGLNSGGCDADCNGVIGGVAYIDNCNTCVEGNTGLEACEQDCEGTWGGTALQDECGVCLTDASILPCTGSLEAETACTVDGIQLEAENLGFSGEGYVNTTNAVGSYASWIINSTEAQTATLSFRYANGGTTSRDGALMVNGTTAGNLSLPSTGDWEVWEYASVNLQLEQGANEIIATATTADGLANIDLIAFSEGVEDAQCGLITYSKEFKTEEMLSIYPNPTSGYINWNTETEYNLKSTLGEVLQSGKSKSVDLSNYTSGLYLLELKGQVFKVIKK